MLSGKMVRVRHVRNRVAPSYIDPKDAAWLDVAERLLELFRSFSGCSREELEEEIRDTIGDNPGQIVHQGLAKLLEDRCDFEVISDHPPDEVRDRVFRAAAEYRIRAAATPGAKPFDRQAVLESVAAELGVSASQIDQGLFADLKGEQRLMRFEDVTAENLLHRYNVALAQAVLLRSTGVVVQVFGETPGRYRQLFRAIKFHRLICDVQAGGPDAYTLRLDGPLSLFSATQKYGLQLASFLPTLLQCKSFQLTATVRWGAERKEKTFQLSSADGLRSHVPDYGSYVPKELTMFAESFRKSVEGWEIAEETAIVPLANGFWTPDFKLTHTESGQSVYLEILGFWRRTDAEKQYQRLRKELGGGFILAVSEQMNIEESLADDLSAGIYRFKRTPLPDEIARLAEAQIDAGGAGGGLFA